MKKIIETIKSLFGISDDKKSERCERELDENINVVVKNGTVMTRQTYAEGYHHKCNL